VSKQIDWPGLMRIALRELRLAPKDFWALTPAEFLVLRGLDGGCPGTSMDRAGLEELIRRYPDGPKGEIDDRSPECRGAQ